MILLTIPLLSCEEYWPVRWGFKNASTEEITIALYACDGVCEDCGCKPDPVEQFSLAPGETRGLETNNFDRDDWDFEYICFGAYTETDPHFAGCGKGCIYYQTSSSTARVCNYVSSFGDQEPFSTTVITKGSPVATEKKSEREEELK